MKKPPKPEQIAEELRQTLDRLIDETHNQTLSARRRRILETDIRGTIANLGKLLNELDPIHQPMSIFDPSNPKIVGRFIALALVAQQRHPLSNAATFYGSGVYAVYYKGKFPLYAPLSGSETPIYVGKAGPAASNARTPIEQGIRLSSRLGDHRKNVIKAVSTLKLDDFECRSLVVQSGWETAAEDYLIHLFRPVWNSETGILYGLGKHGDSADVRKNKRSPWDTLHPGRKWAGHAALVDAKSVRQITDELSQHFVAHPVFQDLDSVFTSFIDELRQV